MRKLLVVANVSKEHIRKFHIPFILRMKALGWQVDVACRMDAPIPECDHAYDLPCDRNPFSGGIGRSVRALRKILRENRYDVVVCNTVTGSIVARLAAKPLRGDGLKVFYINHGLHFFKGAPLSRWMMGYPMEKALSGATDVLITINSADCELARKCLGIAAVERIHGIGVNLQRFRDCRVSDEDKARLRGALGLLPEDLVLTYVAEIIDNKNQMMLLEAFGIVSQALPNAKLLLVGPEHDGGKVRGYISAHGLSEKVRLAGWRDDIPQLLKISDIYVASSKSEGLGVNLIEAMACGLPVVASENRGHCEIIAHGTNGFLVAQNDARAMASHVRMLAGDPERREKIVRQARQDILKYEIDNVLDELCRIFELYV